MIIDTINISVAHAVFDDVIVNIKVGGNPEYQIAYLIDFLTRNKNKISLPQTDQMINILKKTQIDQMYPATNDFTLLPIKLAEHAISILYNLQSDGFHLYLINTGDGCKFQGITYGEKYLCYGIYHFVIPLSEKSYFDNLLRIVYVLKDKSIEIVKFYGFVLAYLMRPGTNKNRIKPNSTTGNKFTMDTSPFYRERFEFPCQLSGTCSFRSIFLAVGIVYGINNLETILENVRQIILEDYVANNISINQVFIEGFRIANTNQTLIPILDQFTASNKTKFFTTHKLKFLINPNYPMNILTAAPIQKVPLQINNNKPKTLPELLNYVQMISDMKKDNSYLFMVYLKRFEHSVFDYYLDPQNFDANLWNKIYGFYLDITYKYYTNYPDRSRITSSNFFWMRFISLILIYRYHYNCPFVDKPQLNYTVPHSGFVPITVRQIEIVKRLTKDLKRVDMRLVLDVINKKTAITLGQSTVNKILPSAADYNDPLTPTQHPNSLAAPGKLQVNFSNINWNVFFPPDITGLVQQTIFRLLDPTNEDFLTLRSVWFGWFYFYYSNNGSEKTSIAFDNINSLKMIFTGNSRMVIRPSTTNPTCAKYDYFTTITVLDFPDSEKNFAELLTKINQLDMTIKVNNVIYEYNNASYLYFLDQNAKLFQPDEIYIIRNHPKIDIDEFTSLLRKELNNNFASLTKEQLIYWMYFCYRWNLKDVFPRDKLLSFLDINDIIDVDTYLFNYLAKIMSKVLYEIPPTISEIAFYIYSFNYITGSELSRILLELLVEEQFDNIPVDYSSIGVIDKGVLIEAIPVQRFEEIDYKKYGSDQPIVIDFDKTDSGFTINGRKYRLIEFSRDNGSYKIKFHGYSQITTKDDILNTKYEDQIIVPFDNVSFLKSYFQPEIFRLFTFTGNKGTSTKLKSNVIIENDIMYLMNGEERGMYLNYFDVIGIKSFASLIYDIPICWQFPSYLLIQWIAYDVTMRFYADRWFINDYEIIDNPIGNLTNLFFSLNNVFCGVKDNVHYALVFSKMEYEVDSNKSPILKSNLLLFSLNGVRYECNNPLRFNAIEINYLSDKLLFRSDEQILDYFLAVAKFNNYYQLSYMIRMALSIGVPDDIKNELNNISNPYFHYILTVLNMETSTLPYYSTRLLMRNNKLWNYQKREFRGFFNQDDLWLYLTANPPVTDYYSTDDKYYQFLNDYFINYNNFTNEQKLAFNFSQYNSFRVLDNPKSYTDIVIDLKNELTIPGYVIGTYTTVTATGIKYNQETVDKLITYFGNVSSTVDLSLCDPDAYIGNLKTTIINDLNNLKTTNTITNYRISNSINPEYDLFMKRVSGNQKPLYYDDAYFTDTAKNILAYYEMYMGFILRQEQIDLIKQLRNDLLNKKTDYYYQLVMGSGKSSAIIPLVAIFLILIDLREIVIIIQPRSLVNQMKLTIINNLINLFDVSLEIGTIDKISRRKIVILNDFQIKRLLLLNHKVLQDVPIIYDEVDDLADNSKSELNIIKGNKSEIPYLLERTITMYKMIRMVQSFPTLDRPHGRIFTRKIPKLDIFEGSTQTGGDVLYQLFDNYTNNLAKVLGTLSTTEEAVQTPAKIRKQAVKKNIEFNLKINLDNIPDDFKKIIMHQYNTITPSIFTRKYNLNYGLDIPHDKYTAIPYVTTDVPTENSAFSDIDYCIAYTILSFMYIDLDIVMIIKIVKILKYEYSLYYTIPERAAQIKSDFGLFFDGSIPNIVTFNTNTFHRINNDFQAIKNRLINTPDSFCRIVAMIMEYYFPMYLNANNISFIDIFSNNLSKSKVGLTGTPFVLPFPDNNGGVCRIKYQDQANGSIIYSMINDSKVYYVLRYESIWKETVDLVKSGRIQVITDVASFFSDTTAEDFALNLSKAVGKNVVFIDRDDNKLIFNVDKSIVPLGATVTNGDIVYFDRRHITGTDLKLPSHYRGLITIDFQNRFRDTAQGIYRERGINNGQTIDFLSKIKIENSYEMAAHLINEELRYQRQLYYYWYPQVIRMLCRSDDNCDYVINTQRRDNPMSEFTGVNGVIIDTLKKSADKYYSTHTDTVAQEQELEIENEVQFEFEVENEQELEQQITFADNLDIYKFKMIPENLSVEQTVQQWANAGSTKLNYTIIDNIYASPFLNEFVTKNYGSEIITGYGLFYLVRDNISGRKLLLSILEVLHMLYIRKNGDLQIINLNRLNIVGNNKSFSEDAISFWRIYLCAPNLTWNEAGSVYDNVTHKIDYLSNKIILNKKMFLPIVLFTGKFNLTETWADIVSDLRSDNRTPSADIVYKLLLSNEYIIPATKGLVGWVNETQISDYDQKIVNKYVNMEGGRFRFRLV